MKKQTFARRNLITVGLLLLLVPTTLIVTYKAVSAHDQREKQMAAWEEEVWEIYYQEVLKGNQLPNLGFYLESTQCACPCPNAEEDLVYVQYHDIKTDSFLHALLFESYLYRNLFQRGVKPPAKYLVVLTKEMDTYADEFSPVPLYVDQRHNEVVLKGREDNTLHIKVKDIQSLNRIIAHIESRIPCNIPVI